MAIELAPAQVKVLTVRQIIARLGDRFRLLTAERRAVLPRHQSLQATINSSHDILTKLDQMLFQMNNYAARSWRMQSPIGTSSLSGAKREGDTVRVFPLLLRSLSSSKRVHESPVTCTACRRKYQGAS